MGIPSYFSFIIRNHPDIITNLEQLLQSPAFQQPTSTGFQHLFFDANSIIYDAFHALHKEHRAVPIPDFDDSRIFFPLLTQRVIEIIEKHIHFIQPSETLFIAFDGMPPPAKIIQQKSRRFKTRHLDSMVKEFQHLNQQTQSNQPTAPNQPKTSAPAWQTNMITPGTPFMTFLSETLKTHFKKRATQHPLIKIQILSTSTDKGEGEHKIFHYLRNHPPKPTDQIALYGLDSDLIMLSLLSVPNIYIFREAPAFLASKIDDILQKIQSKHKFSHGHQTNHNTHANVNTNNANTRNPPPPPLNPENLPPYFLNINRLANAIRQSQSTPITSETQNPVYDYVFMCFLLGNDFLPHISSLNLRTNGLHILNKQYQQKRPKPLQLIHPTTQTIQWQQVLQLLEPIAKTERELLLQENTAFRKLPRPNPSKIQTDLELQEFITAAPQIYTAAREYIRPEIAKNWQQRYRKVFPTACPLRFLKQMFHTWEYYLGRLSNLEYITDAPPLIEDIVTTLQDFHPTQFDTVKPLQTFQFKNNEEYLAFVLDTTPMTYDFTYSKMLWEVHVH